MFRIVLFASIFLVLTLFACGPCVTDAEVPESATPDSSFQVTVFIMMDYDAGQDTGGVAIQIPSCWSADQVEFFGPDSGAMVYSDTYTSALDSAYLPPAGYKWSGFRTEDIIYVEGGESFTVLMTVHTDDLQAVVELSFHSANIYAESWDWDYDPLGGFFVEILPGTLEPQTWAEIKTSFD